MEIQSIDLFGKRIGFMKIKTTTVNTQTNKTVPGIVFLRGDAVAILPVITSESQQFVLVTEQVRVPIGQKFLEIPAGMTDGDGNLSGVAIKELQEETGISSINAHDLVSLGQIVPSPGGCDEKLHLYLLKLQFTDAQIAEM